MYPDLVKEIAIDEMPPSQPLVLDLKAGNSCNLKCRICGPVSSTLWRQEHRDIYGPSYSNFEGVEFRVEDPELQNLLNRARRIELSGGEPFLNKSYPRILQYLVERNLAAQIELQITTNATIFPKQWIAEWFPHFRNVTILLSIDGTNKQFEYQRHPAKWPEVFENYKLFRDTPYFGGIVLTVSLFNLYYVAEYLKFWDTQNESRVLLNILMSPRHLNIRALPSALRQQLSHKLYSTDTSEAYREQLNSLIRILNSEDESDAWPAFIASTKAHDKYRSESFRETFSKFYALCKNQGLSGAL
jgi:sulfatase maturation enzyme AslB (radical SAM superfamily)